MAEPVERRAPDRETFAQVARRLGGAQKSAVGVPAYLRFVNRKAGGVLAVTAYRAGLTPNHVTALSALSAVAAIVCLVTVEPSAWLGFAVAGALCLGYALDSADGQLARLQGRLGAAGEWLDHVVDCGKSLSLHAAVLVSMYRFFDLSHAALLLLPVAFSTVSVTFYFAMMLRDQLMRGRGPDARAGSASVARSFLLLPVDYGALCLCFCLLGAETLFLTVYGLLFLCTALLAVHGLPKAYRLLSSA
jgi:phosphatidylglycerophosphate synthase